ncbi:MAG TPA: hypothetical protein VK603_19810, partial [Candidatus Saccharimonadales bacterium]|nr:hypothetical protein [Candidatus Saccharimonadales bacterium]
MARRSFKLRRQWYEQDIDFAHHLALIKGYGRDRLGGRCRCRRRKKKKVLKVADIYLRCGTSQG